MVEFMQDYWYFIVAGLIFIAVLIYWIIEAVLAKKERVKRFKLLEAQAEQEDANVAQEETKTSQEEMAKEEVLTKKEEPSKSESKEKPEDKKKGAYSVSYDKDSKEWIVKRRGSERASKRTKTKKEALEVAQRLSDNNEVGFVVKKRNGKFQKK